MKRNIIYVMTLLLPLLMGCKQGSNADQRGVAPFGK